MSQQEGTKRTDGTDTGSEQKTGTREVKRETLLKFDEGTDVEDCTKSGREFDGPLPPRRKN